MMRECATGRAHSQLQLERVGRAPGLGWYLNKSRPETEQSSAAYQNAAIAICARCSSRRPGWCWSRSGQSIGSATGSSRGSKRQRSGCISRCSNMPCAEGRVIPAAGTSDYCGSLCTGRRLLRRPYDFIPFYLLFERVVFAKPVSTFAGDAS